MRASGLFVAVLLPLVVAACGSGGAAPAEAAGPLAQRLLLNEGYSLLYADASHIGLVELALYLKFESQGFHAAIREASAYGDEFKRELERVAREYPGVRIDLKPLPEMEMRKRSAIAEDRMLEFAPVTGRGGPAYERAVLMSMAGGLNHESHLCRVMAQEEPDPGLKIVLLAAEKRYDHLNKVVMGLLDREYFK
jgi:hypothetical protein